MALSPGAGRGTVAFVAIGFAVALVVVAVARLALFGWAAVAPDDARYVYVGLSTLDGDGPLTPSGNLFLLRSPVYGIALAAGSVLAGDGHIDGARIVAVILTVAGLLAAVRFAALLGSPVAAAGTSLALLATPLIWRLVPTLRVDLPQTAGVVAVLLALYRPTARRWALAGALFGLTVLVKETILLLGLAPLAFAGAMPRVRLARLWAVFLAAAGVVAGWWWVVVWVQSGTIFPLDAVGVIEGRDVGSDTRVDLFGVGLFASAAAAWLIVLAGARHDHGLRLLIAAAVCLVPPAAYATLNGLNTRNYAGLAVLSAIALGVAGSRILSAWSNSRPVPPADPARSPRDRRARRDRGGHGRSDPWGESRRARSAGPDRRLAAGGLTAGKPRRHDVPLQRNRRPRAIWRRARPEPRSGPCRSR